MQSLDRCLVLSKHHVCVCCYSLRHGPLETQDLHAYKHFVPPLSPGFQKRRWEGVVGVESFHKHMRPCRNSLVASSAAGGTLASARQLMARCKCEAREPGTSGVSCVKEDSKGEEALDFVSGRPSDQAQLDLAGATWEGAHTLDSGEVLNASCQLCDPAPSHNLSVPARPPLSRSLLQGPHRCNVKIKREDTYQEPSRVPGKW